MSEAVSALQGAGFDGFVRISDAGPRGMITLRGDLSSRVLQKAATNAVGAAFPGKGAIVAKGDSAIAWMSPDEVLLLCPYVDAAKVVAVVSKALAGTHHLVVNVSDARAMFTVKGDNARDVLAKVSPANVAPGAFGPGQFRRTRLAQVAGAFWMPDETTINVICFRSVARYVFDLLAMSAKPGSEAEYF